MGKYYRMPLAKSALLIKLNSFALLSEEEETHLTEALSKPFVVQRDKQLFHEGQPGLTVFVVQHGWASGYKDLPDGGRQIINFAIPGDCVGLRNVLLKASDHTFSALTEATFRTIDAARMMQLFDDFPRIRAGFLWSAARDEAMTVEHLVGVGRRTAMGRIAHFFMELAERLTLVGLATETEFRCPLNQYAMADALGLSAIHVNRVLRVLRERGLLSMRSGTAIIHDLRSLGSVANYHSLSRPIREHEASLIGPTNDFQFNAGGASIRSDK